MIGSFPGVTEKIFLQDISKYLPDLLYCLQRLRSKKEKLTRKVFHIDVDFFYSTAGASGVRSLEDVQNAMSNQSLRYVFPFSQFSFNTDIGFLLLVEGRQSPFFAVGSPTSVFILPPISLAHIQQTDISLPFRPQNGDITQLYKHEPEVKMPEHGHVDVFRNFLSGARQREKLRVPKQLAEVRKIN